MSNTLLLTDAIVRGLPLTPGKQKRFYDTKLPGFGVVVGALSRKYFMRVRLGHQEKFIPIGPAEQWTVKDARRRAQDLATDTRRAMQAARETPALVLPRIWPALRERLDKPWKRRKGPASPRTIEQYTDCYERVLAPLHDTPLDHLGRNPALLMEFQKKITEENGPYMANRVRTVFGMMYDLAQGLNPTTPLPPNPIGMVNRNPEERRQTGLGREEMPAWWNQLQSISAVRREFHLLTLLSGLRPSSLCPAEWPHLRLKDRALYVYAKGNDHFWIPLSTEMLECIERARIAGKLNYPKHCDRYIFPADSESGHMEKPKEPRHKLSHYGDDLRQTFVTMAEAIKIPDKDIKALMNHTIPGEKRRTKRSPGDVTRGYGNDFELRPELRESQQRISTYIMEHLTKPLVH